MSRKDCKDCPDRFVRKNEDGHWETCHATCPIYAALVEKSHKISEARQKDRDNRDFKFATRVAVNKIKRHNKRRY